MTPIKAIACMIDGDKHKAEQARKLKEITADLGQRWCGMYQKFLEAKKMTIKASGFEPH